MDENLIERLRRELEAAEMEVSRATTALAPRHVGGEMQAFEAAQERLLAVERQLAEAEDRPYAIPEECSLKWDPGAPMPTLLQCDNRTLLLFYLTDPEKLESSTSDILSRQRWAARTTKPSKDTRSTEAASAHTGPCE